MGSDRPDQAAIAAALITLWGAFGRPQEGISLEHFGVSAEMLGDPSALTVWVEDEFMIGDRWRCLCGHYVIEHGHRPSLDRMEDVGEGCVRCPCAHFATFDWRAWQAENEKIDAETAGASL